MRMNTEKTSMPTKYVDINQDLSWVLQKPRMTEKAASLGADHNIYTFNVASRANKILIKQAIKSYYGVDPIKVTVSIKKPIIRFFRGRRGKTTGQKKAMVFLKKGDTIEFA